MWNEMVAIPLDRTRYEPVPIRIEKSGQWTLAGRAPDALPAAAPP